MSPDPTIAHRIIPPPSNRPRVPRVSDLLPYSDMLPGVDNDEMVPPRPHTRDLSLEVGRREDSDGPAHYLSLRTSHGVIETAVVASNDVREVSALVGQRVWRLTDNYHREALGGASSAGSGSVTSSGELAPGWAAVVLDTGDYGLLPEAYVRWFAVEPESPTRAAIATSAAAAAKARLEVRLEAAKAAGVAVGTARGRQEVEEAAAHMEAVMAANRDAMAAAAAVAQRPPPLPPLPPQPPSPPPPVTVTSPTSPPSQLRFTTAATATPPPQPQPPQPQPSQMDRRPMSPGGTTRLTLTPDGKGLAKTPADLTRAMELLSSPGVSIQAVEGGGGEKGAAAPAATSPPPQQSLNTRALLSPRFTSSSPTSPQPTSPVSPSSPTATSPQPTSPPPIPPPQPEPAASSSSPPASSRWTLTAEHRLLYGAAFESTVAVDGGYMPRARAMRHMSKSNLPAYLLEHAMALVTTSTGSSGGAAAASEGEGAISEIQFVIAMLLVSKGPPLPEVLPIELQEEILTASANATASASTIAAPPPLPPLPPLPVIPKLPKLPPAAAHASTSIFAQLGGREVVVVEVGDPAPVTETKSKNPFYLEAVAAAAEVVEVSDAAAAETKQSTSPPPQQQPRPWQWTTSDTVEKVLPPPQQQPPPPHFVVRIGKTSSGKTRCTILGTHPKAATIPTTYYLAHRQDGLRSEDAGEDVVAAAVGTGGSG